MIRPRSPSCLILIVLSLGAFLTASLAEDGVALSESGSGRATAYIESPKIIRFEGKTHVAWLDSPSEGFRVCVRTLDQATGEWSETYAVGEGYDNHGGPALTVDREGYLHLIYYAHHHPVRYRRSLRPNDASAWTDYERFGIDLTYPALLCAEDGTLIFTARRSYEDRPWELEMWTKAPGKKWSRSGPLIRSRFPGYAQFAASLAWGPDRKTLHLGTRIYETTPEEINSPATTVGYLKSHDGGRTWQGSDGKQVALPVTADSIDVLASGRGSESRVLNAGSLGVDGEGKPFMFYSERVEDASHGYLAWPLGEGKWRHLNLNTRLPEAVRDQGLFAYGGVSFGSEGHLLVSGVVMELSPEAIAWGDVSSELVFFLSDDGGKTMRGRLGGDPDPASPRWMPNLERGTGFNEMPLYPSVVYTDGGRGASLDDLLSNKVVWVPGDYLWAE